MKRNEMMLVVAIHAVHVRRNAEEAVGEIGRAAIRENRDADRAEENRRVRVVREVADRDGEVLRNLHGQNGQRGFRRDDQIGRFLGDEPLVERERFIDAGLFELHLLFDVALQETHVERACDQQLVVGGHVRDLPRIAVITPTTTMRVFAESFSK